MIKAWYWPVGVAIQMESHRLIKPLICRKRMSLESKFTSIKLRSKFHLPLWVTLPLKDMARYAIRLFYMGLVLQSRMKIAPA